MQLKRNIPVTILTGFLGSGKTTLLNTLLRDNLLKDSAVIINEFGEVGIDHLLVEKADEGIISLSDGCLCCTIRGDLVDTLAELIDKLQMGQINHLTRIIIETTGLADPAPILQILLAHPIIIEALQLDGVITTLDAVNGIKTLETYQEAVKQLAVADRVIITKADMVEGKAHLADLKSKITAINPRAEIYLSSDIEHHIGDLFRAGIYDIDNKTADVKRWLADEERLDHHNDAHNHDEHHHNHHHHDHSHHHDDVNRHSDKIRSFSLTHNQPVDYAAIEAFVDLMRASQGERILRMKGIVQTIKRPDQPLIIHGVQGMFHPPKRLDNWPDNKPETRLVIIGDGLDETYVRGLFDAFLNRPAIDTADRQALSDNPLIIPGYKF
ncbi:GTP-binding protein [Bartonella sp. HY329]|uniref:CobW family GTP-binding protein n=1 Tax=unclassified Bartonella TaxID=2645622 RepID=UPI0021C79478|nr:MULTISPECIES: GTP-binding protein [unclassified Bartonella]UXM95167.1 GTP-binding protein [Bartonella sp. HY329]UXN09490.1 GTP-binding protein [Bartonella sp. HY328]